MILRPRQKAMVERSIEALDKHKNTLTVAATGSGKTIMLSATAGHYLKDKDAKSLITAHRDELTSQNRTKFGRVNPGVSTSVYDGTEKNWNGRAVFGMLQSLTTPKGLDSIPALDLLICDEGHHICSPTGLRLVETVMRKNPKCLLYVTTATPERGDKKGLRLAGITNCCDQITIGELIQSGHLVRPRTFVVDLGLNEQLQSATANDNADQSAVADILDHAPVTDAVIRHWKEKAGDRRTVVFAATVEHSKHVCEAFRAAGITAEHVDGEMATGARKAAFARLDSGETQVLCNVAIATEGFDSQPVSCVVLLRKSSHISTYIQMVGRALRTVDPEMYPGIVKSDAVVLDFGASTLIHGTLETSVYLESQGGNGEGPKKVCPECDSEIPAGCKVCPLCGYEFPAKDKPGPKEVSDFIMTEVDLLARSPFRWEALWPDGASLIATGFSAWAGVFWWNGVWHAVGCRNGERLRHIAQGDKTVCLAAADDFMLENETDDSAQKSRKWLGLPPTDKQCNLIRNFGVDVAVYPEAGAFGYQIHKKAYGRADVVEIAGAECSRYRAACYLSFLFNKQKIKDVICGQDRMAA